MKSILITSSILIALIAALRPLLRGRIDPRVQYALWLIVALRLLVPVELASSAHSALALLDRAEAPALLADAIGSISVPVPGLSYEDAYQQALLEYQQNKAVTTSFNDLDQVELLAREIQAKRPTLAELATKYATPVWLGGTALMAAWFLLVNLRLRRRLRRAALIEVEPTSRLPVFVSDALPSPCLCGVVRPAIYVTSTALSDPDRMRHVLAHEATHYRHRDHWWALARCLCLCVYWFDPLVWWAAAMSRQDCELACDAGAIRRLGEAERLPYGRTLVAMISAGRNSLLQTATTMTGGKRRVKERVELIAHRPKTAVALALALVLVLGLTVGFTFTGAPEKDPVPTGLSADSLRERLMDVPEELKPTVTASAPETKAGINDIALVSYWWDVPAEWESEQSSWLLDVHRWERSLIDSRGWPQISDEPTQIIAQDEEFYYVLEWPGNPRFQMADSEPFTAAYQAIRAYAMEQVLATEGVEPYAYAPDGGPDASTPPSSAPPVEPPVEPTAELLGLDGLDAALFQGAYQAYFGQEYRTTFEDFPRVVLPDVAIYGAYEEDGVQYYVGNVLYHVHYFDNQTGTFEDNAGAVHVPCRIGLRDSGGAYEVADAMIPPDGAGYYPAVQEIIGPLEELSQAYESGIFVGLTPLYPPLSADGLWTAYTAAAAR